MELTPLFGANSMHPPLLGACSYEHMLVDGADGRPDRRFAWAGGPDQVRS